MIPYQYALRRRVLSNPQEAILPTCAVTLEGEFLRNTGYNTDYWGMWVVIDNEIIAAPGVYAVPYGSEIVLYVVRVSQFNSASIFKDGALVASLTSSSDPTLEATYSHTVVGDCSIVGIYSNNVIGLYLNT